ncbi:peroxisomal membrane anchor protein conserved region-domain-containing protein [Tricladium varicosporioides]|nr:peroxisomal membrane anchor protein conserved region-domain-containing protein [Hymenoscyphus varicosporioides]
MSDSDDEKKAGVPSWQLNKDESDSENTKESPIEPESRATILEQAKKFLEEDEVKNASTDKKIAFLETKGLREGEIQELLAVTRNSEASSSTSTESVSSQASQPTQDAYTRLASSQISQPSSQSSSPPQQTYTPPQTSSSSPQPPIITYPEFLVAPAAPQPLVTKPRLLTTLYAFSALSLLLYGTNTYLVTPMVAQLTSSRHELASSASTNLQKLIEKLEGLVSTVPNYVGKKQIDEGGEEEEDSETEDPTELFHRDIGVQTSPILSPSSSHPPSPPPGPASTLNDQVTRLSGLTQSMKDLITDSTSEGTNTSELETTINVLREYLDSMAYVAPSFGFGGGGYSGGYGIGGKAEDDEISKVKAGIRGVKGVLLSARSFPGGVRSGGR